MSYTVYLLECNNNSLYCGITTDLLRRYQEHLQGINCRYTRAFPPKAVAAAWTIKNGGKSTALKIEAFIKKQSRKKKGAIISSPAILNTLLAKNDIIADDVTILPITLNTV